MKSFIRLREVVARTGLSKSYIYALTKEGKFPNSVTLIEGGKAVGWIDEEVQDWIDSRIKARNEGVE